ncbi:MAG: hypothetical protein R3Y44_00635 [Rikenellaceae bacterium]
MKKVIITLLLSMCSSMIFAQVKVINISPRGQIYIEVALPNNGFVIMDQYGSVKRMYAPELRVDRYSDFRSYEAGKIEQIGDLKFKYHSDFWDYESGKLASIGDIKFEYYSNFRDSESGKIKSIGGVPIAYYSDFRDYESGKLKSIGSHKYSYYSSMNSSYSGTMQSGVLDFTQNEIRFIIDARRRR